jgi:hypothetical protein
MMGGLGGTGYESPGSAVLSGIQAGQSMYWNARNEQDRYEQMQYERGRQDRVDQMRDAEFNAHMQATDDAEKLQHAQAALTGTFAQQDDIGRQMDADAPNYGGKDRSSITDPAMQKAFTAKWAPQVGAVNQQLQSIRQVMFAPYMRDQQKWADDYEGKLNSGGLDLSQPGAGADLYKYANLRFHIDPTQFLRGPDGTSPVGAAVDAIAYAHQNPTAPDAAQKLSYGTGILYGNQVNTGLGQLGRTGAPITGVTIQPDKPVVPARDGVSAHPVTTVESTTQDGSMYHVDPYQPMMKDGVAGVPGQQGLVTVPPEKQIDQMHRYKTFELALASNPDAGRAIADAAQHPPQEVLNYNQMLGYIGVQSKTSNTEAHFFDAKDPITGQTVHQSAGFDKYTGAMVGKPTTYAQAPDPKEGALQQKLDAIDADTTLTPAQKRTAHLNAYAGAAGAREIDPTIAAARIAAGVKEKEASVAEIKEQQAEAAHGVELDAGVIHSKKTDAQGNTQDTLLHADSGVALTPAEQLDIQRKQATAVAGVYQNARPVGSAPHKPGAAPAAAPPGKVINFSDLK